MNDIIELIVYALAGFVAICLYEIIRLHAKMEALRTEMLCRIDYETDNSPEVLAARHHRLHQNDDLNELIVEATESVNSSKTQENG